MSVSSPATQVECKADLSVKEVLWRGLQVSLHCYSMCLTKQHVDHFVWEQHQRVGEEVWLTEKKGEGVR